MCAEDYRLLPHVVKQSNKVTLAFVFNAQRDEVVVKLGCAIQASHLQPDSLDSQSVMATVEIKISDELLKAAKVPQ
jgi:hypothetical protein